MSPNVSEINEDNGVWLMAIIIFAFCCPAASEKSDILRSCVEDCHKYDQLKNTHVHVYKLSVY